jgi:hypothetical protein
MFVRSLVTALVHEFLVGSMLLRGMCDYRSPALPPKPTPSGLPQGVALSTTLFSLCLFDMPCPPYTQLAYYAEDTVLLSQSWRPDIISRTLSQDLTTLLRYFTKWKFRLNAHKTESILFSKCHLPPSRILFKSMTSLCPWPLGLVLEYAVHTFFAINLSKKEGAELRSRYSDSLRLDSSGFELRWGKRLSLLHTHPDRP